MSSIVVDVRYSRIESQAIPPFAQFNPISFYAEGLVLDACKRPSEICPFKDFYNIVPNTKQKVLGYPLTLYVTSSLPK